MHSKLLRGASNKGRDVGDVRQMLHLSEHCIPKNIPRAKKFLHRRITQIHQKTVIC